MVKRPDVTIDIYVCVTRRASPNFQPIWLKLGQNVWKNGSSGSFLVIVEKLRNKKVFQLTSANLKRFWTSKIRNKYKAFIFRAETWPKCEEKWQLGTFFGDCRKNEK